MRVPIYLVVKPTGQKDEDGRELVITIGAKLTHGAAAILAQSIEGARVEKLIADKQTE